ncbi:substrate-binding domain-containing protein [Amycolatopsis sp. NPDC004625]|uniref:substrate-binding domain-containing protein n=1 Tax=Amycolatopsis sp. NPDC004625 TaxID=3154670 RepID=UPI0033B90866
MVIALVLAIAASALVLGVDTLVVRRRRIGYRVLMDGELTTKPGVDVLLKQPLSRDGEVIADPTVALVRVRNIGAFDLDESDLDDLTIAFPGRRTLRVEVSRAPGGVREALADGLQAGDDTLAVPPIRLRRHEGFDLLALLSGNARGVQVSGRVRGGRVVEDRRRPPRAAIAATVVLCLALGGLVATTLPLGRDTSCAGRVKVLTTSLAEPVLRQAAADYRRVCDGAAVDVVISQDSVATLLANGQSGDTIAVGTGTSADPRLVRTPYSVVLFGAVVNPATGVPGLTRDQIRWIYAGAVTNWNQVGGPDLPIVVIGRDASSATRRTFESKVLGKAEPAPTSNDCVTRTQPGGSLRCEAGSSAELLARVAAIRGAIGYADVGAIEKSGARPIAIEGNTPDIATVRGGGYPFWDVLSTYTFGPAAPDSPVGAFLRYLRITPAAATAAGFVPCTGPPC